MKATMLIRDLLTILTGVTLLAGCRKGSGKVNDNGTNASNSPLEGRRLISGVLARESHKRDTSASTDFRALSEKQLIGWLETNYIPNSITAHYLEACTELSKRDPALALKTLCTKERIHDFYCYKAIADNLAQIDPETLGIWLKESLPKLTQDRSLLTEYYSQGLSSLARSNAGDALEIATGSITEPGLRVRALQSIFQTLGEIDPRNAIAMVQAGHYDVEQDKIRMAIGIGAAARQPEISVEIGKTLSNMNDRGVFFSSIFNQWLQHDPIEAVTALQSMPDLDFETILKRDFGGSKSILNTLAETSPDVLFKKMGTMVPSSSNSDLFGAMVAVLARENAEETIRTVESLPDSQLKSELIAQTFYALGEANADVNLLKRLISTDPVSRTDAIEGFASSVGQLGFSSVIQIAEQLELQDRGTFISEAISSINGADLLKAAEFSIRMQGEFPGISEQQQGKLIVNLGARMAINDPSQAKEWYSKVPAGLQIDAMQGLSREMVKNDIQGFATWLGSQRQDGAWRVGVETLIRDLNYSDPEIAAQWKNSLKAANVLSRGAVSGPISGPK